MDPSKTLYKSDISADKVYTGFKWSLRDWSLLHEHYKLGVRSPEFTLTGMHDLKCQLKFKWNNSHSGRRAYASLNVKLLNEIEVRGLQVAVSFVDEKSEKLKQFYQYSKGIVRCWEIQLDNNGQRSLSDYLQNDALIFFVEITIVKGIKNGPSTVEVWNGGLKPDARTKVVDFYLRSDLTDVTFLVEDKKFHAHRLILAASSKFFRDKFTVEARDQSEMLIELWECATTFEAFLRYMYTGQVENLQDVVDKLIRMAVTYEVPDLKEMCESFMSNNLDSENVIDYLLAASDLSCAKLEKKAIECVRANMHILGNSTVLTQLVNKPTLLARVFDIKSAP